jgi:uncharacterized protein with PIN domain
MRPCPSCGDRVFDRVHRQLHQQLISLVSRRRLFRCHGCGRHWWGVPTRDGSHQATDADGWARWPFTLRN